MIENNEQQIVKGMSEDRKLAEDYILNYTKHKKDYERKKRGMAGKGPPSVKRLCILRSEVIRMTKECKVPARIGRIMYNLQEMCKRRKSCMNCVARKGHRCEIACGEDIPKYWNIKRR